MVQQMPVKNEINQTEMVQGLKQKDKLDNNGARNT